MTMHINIKAPKSHVFETPEQAIQELWIMGLYPQKAWLEIHFGRDLAAIRKAGDAIKAKDYSAFKALPRKGYWRVELA
jgi:hypothetical protein